MRFPRLNTIWHKQALFIFAFICLAHLAEHIVQMIQMHVFDIPMNKANGVLGMWFPWLIESEVLHYAYALVMLIGLFLLWPGFAKGTAGYFWWGVAVVIQIWHHFEHCLLIGQAIAKQNLWDSPVPISVLQLVFPRAELHFVYNLLVLIPMVFAMWYHGFKDSGTCNCRKRYEHANSQM